MLLGHTASAWMSTFAGAGVIGDSSSHCKAHASRS